MAKQVEVHPAANIFPLMNQEEYTRLRDDIDKNGLRESLVFWQNKLVDGRNRLRACEELGIEPGESELDEEQDPVAYVISANMHRRQLKTSQRAMCAAKMAGLPRGANQHTDEDAPNGASLPHDEAASLFNVGRRSVQRALDVLHDGCAELIRLCELGELSVNAACKLIEMCVGKKEQAKIAKKGAKAVREHVATPTVDQPMRYDKEEIDLPDEPTPGQVGVVERWLAQQDERPKFEQFKAIWEAADEVGKSAIRAFVLDHVCE